MRPEHILKGKMFLIRNISNNDESSSCSPIFKKQEPPKDDELTHYYDQFFKKEIQSIFKSHEARKFSTANLKVLKNLIWVRPNEVFKNKFDLYNELQFNDIKLGLIENSYFLSSLGSLANFGDIFHKILINNSYNPKGLYKIRFYINGKPKIVCLDDYLPAYPTKSWVFSYSNSSEFCVQLMEKAWAKVCGSYAATMGGIPSDALNSLVESPCLTLCHERLGKDRVWKEVMEASDNNYIICTNSDDDDDLEELGLMKNQSYTIIKAKEFKGSRFVRLRNPWGGYEWKGDYSDDSDKWTKELKESLGFINDNDGRFFMSYEDFFKYFDYTYVSKYHNGFEYNFKKFYQESINHFVIAKIVVLKSQKVYIGLHQKQEKFYKKIKNYKLGHARLLVAKFNAKSKDENCYEYIGSDFSHHDKLYVSEELTEGEYHIFGNIKWKYNERCSLVISTYSSDLIEVKNLEEDLIPSDFLSQILSSYVSRKSKELISNGLFSKMSFEDNHTGYAIIKFINDNSDVNYKISFDYDDSNFLLISGKDEKNQIYVQKNNYKIVIFEAVNHIKRFNIENIMIDSIDTKGETYDVMKSFFSRILENIEKKKLNNDCYSIEYYNLNSVFIIIVNHSVNRIYKAKINYNKLVNLKSDINQKVISFQNFEYFELTRSSLSDEIHYEYKVSLKCKKV